MGVPDPRLYALVAQVLQAVLGPLPGLGLAAIGALVWAVLCGQSLHPAAPVRARPALTAAGARRGFRRVRRGLERPWLSSRRLTPVLAPAVLRLVADAEVLLVLDSSRCGRWELVTLGLRCHGRVLPVAWAALPYPWPAGRFTPAVVALLERALAGWPADRPVHLVADRGFPSLPFFRLLDRERRRLPLGYTIRLRAGDWVWLEDGQAHRVGDLLPAAAPGRRRTWPAACRQGRQAGAPATLVAGRGLPGAARHQTGPADQARRRARAEQRAAYLRGKGQPRAVTTDTAWFLLTTAASVRQAIAHYSGRSSTEGAYRDLKGWGWEAVVAHQPAPGLVDGLTGLAALSYLVQASIGAAAGRAGEAGARARQRQWTPTGRLSIFGRGRLVLQDRAHDWSAWLSATLPAIAQRLTTAAAGPLVGRAFAPPAHHPPRQEAA